MSGNRIVFGISVVCFITGMCVGGFLAEFKRQDIPAKEQEMGRMWERKEPSPADSTLDDPSVCYLCGNHNRSLMSMFRGTDDLGVICVNDWYVMPMQIRNLNGMGGDGSGWMVGAEGSAAFRQTGIRNGEFQKLR